MVRSSFLVRCFGVLGVGALGWLPACSGAVMENTGSGGSGAAGAEGGSGGEGTTASGSEGGGGTTGSDAACSPACDEHSACVDGECAPIRIAWLSAFRATFHGPDGYFAEGGRVRACEEPSTPPPVIPVLAEEGDCIAVEPVDPPDVQVAALPQVVAKAPSFGVLPLPESMACAGVDVPLTPAFLEGEIVTFEVAAGELHPAFTLESKSPPPFTLTTGTLNQAQPQPLEIAWESTQAPDSVYLRRFGAPVAIVCSPTGGTSVVIASSLTSLLPPGDWEAVGVLRGEVSTLDLSPTYRAQLSTTGYEYVAVPSYP